MILILFCAVLAISNFETTPIDSDENLSIPQWYRIVNSSDNFALLESDQYHTISISTLENLDKNVLKHLLSKSMHDFTYQDSYTKGEYAVEENWYN